MDFQFLDDSTLWVAISFILFVLLSIKPILNQLSSSLDKKIADLKSNIDESRKLKEEAEILYKDQLEKQKSNVILINRIQEETQNEIKKIKSQIKKEIEQNMLRKINNYDLIFKQMENNVKNDLKDKIRDKVIEFTEIRIKKKLSKKYNTKLIEDSIKNIPKQLS